MIFKCKAFRWHYDCMLMFAPCTSVLLCFSEQSSRTMFRLSCTLHSSTLSKCKQWLVPGGTCSSLVGLTGLAESRLPASRAETCCSFNMNFTPWGGGGYCCASFEDRLEKRKMCLWSRGLWGGGAKNSSSPSGSKLKKEKKDVLTYQLKQCLPEYFSNKYNYCCCDLLLCSRFKLLHFLTSLWQHSVFINPLGDT